jgi:hypothetical protein
LKRLLSALLAVCIVLISAACGNVFIRGALPGGTSSISGSVSFVQLTAIIGENGTIVDVTFVTFLQDGASSTIGFCGDERSRFPMQQSVRANFTPGQTCASIVTIVISDLGRRTSVLSASKSKSASTAPALSLKSEVRGLTPGVQRPLSLPW